MSTWQKYLKDIYYNPANPASFSGPNKLFHFVQKDGKYILSEYKLRKWLSSQEPYSLQRPYRWHQNRTSIVVAGIDDQWSADLMDLVKFAKYNDGYRYILVVIDLFSKYLWLRKLKDKKGESVAKAFETIFKEGRKPYKMRTDKGQEFRARTVQFVFKEAGIKHFYAQNEVKASVAERVIKTIKTKIYIYFTFKQSYRYIDKLQSFAGGYNHTNHGTIDAIINLLCKV
jgi:transposase InsO family protein